MNIEHSTTIENACRLITAGDLVSASHIISTEYPFCPYQNPGRNYSPTVMTKIFLRDGFIDRYRGAKLVFPPVLRLLSHYLPTEFPYHKNGKMSEGHTAYWELFPTIDHVVPIATEEALTQKATMYAVPCSLTVSNRTGLLSNYNGAFSQRAISLNGMVC